MNVRATALLALFALAACGGGGASGPAVGTVPAGPNTSALTIGMVDGQLQMSGDTVTAVTLGIDKVEVVGNGSQPAVVTTYSTPNTVNLLSLTSAASPLTFTGTIPAGTYSQIRLLLDTATTTITYTDSGGASHTVPLSVPSATNGNGNGLGSASSADGGDGPGTAGVKVNVDLNAQSGGSYGFILDFNAGQSIVLTGSGAFMMKPVIVATAQSQAGSLSGTVKNTSSAAVQGAEVEALQGGTVVNAGVTDASGSFTINALPAGSYTLAVLNSYTTAGGQSLTAKGCTITAPATTCPVQVNVSGSVTVTANQTTQVPAITD
ncbi:MAG: DUF4382 domain-containing protein [bacterium]|nr:DUF4382 domain-containing protein [bacterium]